MSRMKRKRGRRGRSGLILLTVGAAVALSTGCGNLTAGGVGEASVAVSGDAAGEQSAVSRSRPALAAAWAPLSLLPRAGFAARADDEPEGEVGVEFRIFLVRQDGELVPLSDREIRVQVEFPGGTEARPVRRRIVPAETYRGVRAVFTEIEAEVDRGLVIGGDPVTGPVEVELDDGSLAVEESVELTVPDGGEVELLLDLNSAAWLRAANPAVRRVAANIFRNSLRIRVR